MTNNFDTTPPAAPLSPGSAPDNRITPTVPRRKWLTPALALIAMLVIGLFGGVLIGHSTAASAQSANAGGFVRGANGGGKGGAGFVGGGFAAGGFTSGTIVSISGTTMVIKAQDGTTKTITTSGTTKVSKTTSTTLPTLKAGQTVTVAGTPSSNGDIAATSVSEGANRRVFGPRPGTTKSPSSRPTSSTNG